MIDELKDSLELICRENNLSLYDFEFKNTQKGKTLMVFITKAETESEKKVTIKDCTQISRKINSLLETKDFLPENYYLEVSSPGLERKLKKKDHFLSAIGEVIKVTYKKFNKNETIQGILTDCKENEIFLKAGEKTYNIDFGNLVKARTIFEFKKRRSNEQ